MTSQIQIIKAAIISFTRIPLNGKDLDESAFNQSVLYLPLIGLIIGLIYATVYQIATIYLSELPAIVLALTAGILVTGALHEDGFADQH